MSSLARSLYRFWRALDDADCVWLMGRTRMPSRFAAIAALRRRRVVLGVRQTSRRTFGTAGRGAAGCTSAG